ncbi:MAG: hypothetical protein K9M54_09850 [Kiritimatiellales bacterium]|nr:hypothetical protein [Kiritimatiellales bacterium]MCF7863579.1 hypothetical protein [Kiritimatiellales bacterium]
MKFNGLVVVAVMLAHGVGARTVELIADGTFENGLNVTDRAGHQQRIAWNAYAAPPVWDVAQHYSKSSLADQAFQSFTTNGFSFKDAYQVLAVHPADEDADLVCGVNGIAEFGGVARVQGDPWPHLFLGQRISAPSGHLGNGSPSLAEIERIDFTISIKLLHDRKKSALAYRKQRHAAQYLFFLTVQNLNRESKGYGDYYWFGMALYDDRYAVTALHAMMDTGSAKKPGTDKMIYNVGIKPFTNQVVADGEWVPIAGDLMPYIVAGLQECWKRGCLEDSRDLADYRFGGVVMGWEVTGLNDVAMAVKGLRATATLKPDRGL